MAVDKTNKLALLKAIKSATAKMKEYADNLIADVAKAAADAIEEHLDNKNNPHGVTAKQAGALPLSGGTLTGDLIGKYITGTWLQATAANAMATKPPRVCVQDSSGWIYSRTPDQLRGDLNAMKKGTSIAVTIPASGWSEDTTYADYPYCYDIAVSGITAKDRVGITIAPGSLATAVACKLCPTNNTMAGKIRIWAKAVPNAAISAEYWLDQGEE